MLARRLGESSTAVAASLALSRSIAASTAPTICSPSALRAARFVAWE
jgi:hypothetical protein